MDFCIIKFRGSKKWNFYSVQNVSNNTYTQISSKKNRKNPSF